MIAPLILVGFTLALALASVLAVVACIAATIAMAPAHPWHVTGSTPPTRHPDRRFSDVRHLFEAWQVATAAASSPSRGSASGSSSARAQ